MIPMVVQIGLRVLFLISSSLAKPLMIYSPLEGSTDEEELGNITFTLPTTNLSSKYQTTTAIPTRVETDIFSQIVKFLEENMLLILVASTFILVVLLIICGATFMSRRRKVNSYYPSSFPSKMYVDHRDKTGGAKLFNEVPEKPTPELQRELVDSHKQLQEDIIRAAKSLRTPNKSVNAAEGNDHTEKVADHSPDESSKPEDNILDQQLPCPPKEEEQHDVPDSEVDSMEGSLQRGLQQQPQPETDDSQEPLTGRSLRPSSLHIHNDSATLQLIAGEKTAF